MASPFSTERLPAFRRPTHERSMGPGLGRVPAHAVPPPTAASLSWLQISRMIRCGRIIGSLLLHVGYVRVGRCRFHLATERFWELLPVTTDRKSTRLNSSHLVIS